MTRALTAHALAFATTGVLVVAAPLRFAVLVSYMPPESYGYLSLFNTLTSLLPYVVAVGLVWQFQLLAARHGEEAVWPLLRSGSRIVLAMSVPVLIGVAALSSTVEAAGPPLLLAALVTLSSAAVAMTILIAQLLLGVGDRATSVLCLFGYNVLLTAAVVPFVVLDGRVGVVDVLGAWTAAAVVGLVLAWVMLRLRNGQRDALPAASHTLRMTDGLLTLPAQIGPLLLLLLARYVLAVGSAPAELATFALSWTVVDLAYLLAVNVPTMASTEIMLGRASPTVAFLLAGILLVGLSVLGHGALEVFLRAAAPGYSASFLTTAALGAAGVARLATVTWLPKAVALHRERVTGAAYLVVSTITAIALAVGLRLEASSLAVVLALQFGLVAAATIWLASPPIRESAQ